MNRRWIALPFTGALAACAQSGSVQKGQLVGGGTRQIAGAQVADGFLPKPELLGPGGNGRPDQVYVKPREDFHRYTQALLDPVGIVSGPDSQLATVTPEQRDALANSYYANLHKTFSKRCMVTSQTGPGVLRLQFALTDATSSNFAVKTIATYVALCQPRLYGGIGSTRVSATLPERPAVRPMVPTRQPASYCGKPWTAEAERRPS